MAIWKNVVIKLCDIKECTMKIGVTGGTGFIGQYLLKEFSAENQFIVITSREKQHELFNNVNVSYIKSPYNKSGFKECFRDCDCVVHLGAKRSNKENEQSICNYFENISISEELFSACRELGIDNIVNVSTTAVYDVTLKLPFSEEGATAPLSNYGVAKHAVENVARLYNRKWKMKIKSLRVAQVIGLGERAGYMLSTFLERSCNKQVLNVYGKGEAGKEYIYVKDVAEAIICACKAKECFGVYNIGTGVLTTNLELAQLFCEVFENSAGYGFVDKPESVELYLMSVQLAEQKLGFKAKYGVLEALKDMKSIMNGEQM